MGTIKVGKYELDLVELVEELQVTLFEKQIGKRVDFTAKHGMNMTILIQMVKKLQSDNDQLKKDAVIFEQKIDDSYGEIKQLKKDIERLENLNGSNLTAMNSMYADLSKLKRIAHETPLKHLPDVVYKIASQTVGGSENE